MQSNILLKLLNFQYLILNETNHVNMYVCLMKLKYENNTCVISSMIKVYRIIF